MRIGICYIDLIVYESNSLKGKRSVIKSLLGRLKSRFNISIAEIGLNDSWQRSKIGFSCVSNNSAHIDETISKVINFIDGDSRVEITQHSIEIL